MASSSLTFPDVDVDGDLVFSGVEDGNPLGLVSMTEPGLVARLVYADDSAHVDGSLPTAGAWQQAVITAVIELRGTTQADLETKKNRVRAAIRRLAYPAVQSVNGVTTTWRCNMASMTPAADAGMDLNDLENFKVSYVLSIPCHPTPGA